MPIPLIGLAGGLAAWFSALFAAETARKIAIETAKYFLTKALLIFLVCVVLPYVLFNVAVELIDVFLTAAMDYVSQNQVQGVVLQMTGVGGWFANQIKIPECFSMAITLLSVKFALRITRLI